MRCPGCQHSESRVIDSRGAADSIRRRRECVECGERFTTHERVDRQPPWILKKDGRREPFRRQKVLHGIGLACRKRPIDEATQLDAVRAVEDRLIGLRVEDVPSAAVGQVVMEVLREVDDVAYLRFASVYREFESVEQFVETIRPLQEQK